MAEPTRKQRAQDDEWYLRRAERDMIEILAEAQRGIRYMVEDDIFDDFRRATEQGMVQKDRAKFIETQYQKLRERRRASQEQPQRFHQNWDPPISPDPPPELAGVGPSNSGIRGPRPWGR